MKILFLQFRSDKVIAQREKKSLLIHINQKIKTQNVFMDEFGFLEETGFTHIILGGSGEFNLSDRDKKSKYWKKINKINNFLKKEIDNNTNILGICFGHHLLAFLLGSEIKPLKEEKEVGTFKIYPTLEGKKDNIFYKMPKSFFAQEGHKDSILNLPKGAKLLAKSKKSKIQSFRFKNAVGVQFHPDLSVEEFKFRLSCYPDYLSKKEKIKIKEAPFALMIIKNFLKN